MLWEEGKKVALFPTIISNCNFCISTIICPTSPEIPLSTVPCWTFVRNSYKLWAVYYLWIATMVRKIAKQSLIFHTSHSFSWSCACDTHSQWSIGGVRWSVESSHLWSGLSWYYLSSDECGGAEKQRGDVTLAGKCVCCDVVMLLKIAVVSIVRTWW